LFDPSKSKNWKALSGYSWNITYGDKSGASGTVGTDVVAVGGTSVSGQAVEIATQVSSQFVSDTANNGLLGLAFSSLNTGEILSPRSVFWRANRFTVTPKAQKTFFDTAKSSLSFPVFTADLKYHAAGMLYFDYTSDLHCRLKPTRVL
jgi:aspergillopepsin I